ncbi:MED7 protein-domain-containing protein [Phellopilus nigrolimitatus]|nr:MED7 protein-domain-containing protein [Phellopilus nigrolimitatus]
MLDDDIEAELRNPFPSPPSHYQQYSTHNFCLLALLNSRQAENVSDNGEKKDQHDVLADQKDVPDWPLTQLEKPRVDWILEEGQYSVFGDTWHVKEKILSLGEYGGQQLYPADPTMDRRPALLSILRSMLVTYSHLLKSMLAPPPNPNSAESPEWQKHVDWLSVMSQNIMSAANDLRPVQARCNLEAMMTRQLQLRREETAVIHRKCDDLQRRLSELRVAASSMETKYSNQEDEVKRQKEICSVRMVFLHAMRSKLRS